MIMIHDDDDARDPLRRLVSKVEYLFSTCTQKIKIRKPRYETLENDQRFWLKREERTILLMREKWGGHYRCLAPVFILLGGTDKTLIWLLDLVN